MASNYLSLDEVVKLVRNSFQASFLTASKKTAYLQRLAQMSVWLEKKFGGITYKRSGIKARPYSRKVFKKILKEFITMDNSKYGKYFITNPMELELPPDENGNPIDPGTGKTPYMIDYVNRTLVPDSKCTWFMEWIWDMPSVNPVIDPHSHPYDEVLYFVGTDHENYQNLGATIEVKIGDEVHKFDKTCAIYIPAGIEHCPLHWLSVERPHMLIGTTLGEYVKEFNDSH
jgi:hypothetical protein